MRHILRGRQGKLKPRPWRWGPSSISAKGSAFTPVFLCLPLWENLGATSFDVSGNKRDGILTGFTANPWVQGELGAAVAFDEVDDRIVIPGFVWPSNFTLAFWFRIADNTGTFFQYVVSHGSIGVANSINIYMPEGNSGGFTTRFLDSNDTNVIMSTPTGYADGKWHLYTLTVSKQDGSRVFIDAVELASDATRGGDSMAPAGSLLLGSHPTLDIDRFYGGELGGFFIFSAHFDAAAVAGFYSDPWAFLRPDFVPMFDFDFVAANKRRSSGSHFTLSVPPIPDGNLEKRDRPHVAWLYSRDDIPAPAGGGSRLLPEQIGLQPLGGLF